MQSWIFFLLEIDHGKKRKEIVEYSFKGLRDSEWERGLRCSQMNFEKLASMPPQCICLPGDLTHSTEPIHIREGDGYKTSSPFVTAYLHFHVAQVQYAAGPTAERSAGLFLVRTAKEIGTLGLSPNHCIYAHR